MVGRIRYGEVAGSGRIGTGDRTARTRRPDRPGARSSRNPPEHGSPARCVPTVLYWWLSEPLRDGGPLVRTAVAGCRDLLGEEATMTHPRKSLDEVIHAPVRFSIMAALAAVESADFKTVREAVEITDSALSKQVATLEKAGYVEVRKTFVGKRPRTYLSLSKEGRRALKRHVSALQEIASGVAETS